MKRGKIPRFQKKTKRKDFEKMKLYELMAVTSEYENMIVTVDGETVATYDGRNSIPETLNNCTVLCISIVNGAFQVEINA